jgi:hypothetical protein
MKRYFLTCFCLVLGLVACAPPWKVIPQPEITSGMSYQVELPAGWMRNTSNNKKLFISHDGPMLQGIEIQESSNDDAFEAINKKITSDMLPSELAELTLALVKNELPASRVTLLQNTPVLIAGHQGFRLHIKYETSKGLDYEGIISGFATEKKVFQIKYYGTSLHYYQRDLPTYEKVVQSFKLINE